MQQYVGSTGSKVGHVSVNHTHLRQLLQVAAAAALQPDQDGGHVVARDLVVGPRHVEQLCGCGRQPTVCAGNRAAAYYPTASNARDAFELRHFRAPLAPMRPASCSPPACRLRAAEAHKHSPAAAHRSQPMRPASHCLRASPRQTPGSWRAAGTALFTRGSTSRRVRMRRLLSASSAAEPARTFVRRSNPRDPIMITDPRITSAPPLRHKHIATFLADKGRGQRHAAALHFTGCQHPKLSQLA